ncbi:hypothetical protein [Haloglycomyces albus]|uniref:hypothetical protein n=1 Tax=Haloglycomyces albus TaxID=526067 RepID=UPI0012EBC789|nr:hypothetical protein [Haloglycomyces albus]
MTTIKVPKSLRNQLQRMAKDEGAATLAELIQILADRRSGRTRPPFGGFHSGDPLTAEEIDAELKRGFGE